MAPVRIRSASTESKWFAGDWQLSGVPPPAMQAV